MQLGQEKSRFILVLVLGILAMLQPLAIDMYLPSFLAIAQDLNVPAERVQNTLAMFTIGFAIGQLLWGPIADSFGRKPAILIGTFVSALAALLLTQVGEIHHFFIIRFVQGVFAAAPAVVLGALLRDLFSKDYFSKMMSMIMLVSMLAPLIAPIMGGYIAKFFHWHFIFYVLMAMGLLSCVLVFWQIPETLPKEKRVAFGLRNVIRNFAQLVKNKAVVGYVLVVALSFSGLFAFLTSGSIVYIDLYGVAPENFGYFFILNMAVMITFTSLNGKFVIKVGTEKMLRFGITMQLLAGIWLLCTSLFNFGFWSMTIGIAVFVGMISIIGSNATAAILERFPQYAGTANSLAGTIRFSMASMTGFLISLMPVTSASPMLMTMFTCIATGALSYYLLCRKQG